MNANLADFRETVTSINPELLCFEKLGTLQVNLGNRCNQSCSHCHVSAGPSGQNIMVRSTMDKIILFLKKHPDLILDITGGAPEMHPDFKYFIEHTDHITARRIVRTNLTIITEKGMDWLCGFYFDHDIVLAASLPCYTRENVDRQRGAGVFDRSIEALRMLNEVGYSRTHELNLVYNPDGAFLPPAQKELELSFRQHLSEDYNMQFNNLYTITNTPIGKFEKVLKDNNGYESYINMLSENFNPDAANSIMCRRLISVDWQGRLYNCDFNQAQNLPIQDDNGRIMTIDDLKDMMTNPPDIITDIHCFSCTAGAGSSCTGELKTASQDTRQSVKDYYGRVLKNKNDLKTSACCPVDSLPLYQRDIIKMIDHEILDKFYGCGSPIPLCLNKCIVLDCGCGTGRDVFVASYLAGEDGFVIGVDMTQEQLQIGRRNIRNQMKRFGYAGTNVEFRHGYIENLAEIDIEDSSIDVVISNCVLNLSPDKQAVFSEIFRVLKPGGELYFSDIFAGRRVPNHLAADPVLRGECLGGALYIEDFRRMLRDIGCADYRIVAKKSVRLNNPEIENKAGMIDFYSMTVRAFKLAGLEDICEDYGQAATYLGTIPESPHRFMLDDHHRFITGKPERICGNTAAMLGQTRYGKHFKITGDTGIHFGPFACAPVSEEPKSSDGKCC